MSCDDIREALEPYVTGDLEDQEASRIAAHLATCRRCAAAYDTTRALVDDLKDLPNAFEPTRVFAQVPDVAAWSGGGAGGGRRPAQPRRRLWALAAAVLALALVAAVTVVTVPSLAETLPLPIGTRLGDLERQNDAMRAQNQSMQRRVEKLESRIEQLTGDQVNVVPSSQDDLPDEVTMAVQQVVIEFIKAQYAGDLARMKQLGTPALRERIAAHPEEYLRDDAGEVSFAQMTDVGIYEGVYVTFVRLSDTKAFSDSQYQEDFGVKKVGDRYLVDSMEMDA